MFVRAMGMCALLTGMLVAASAFADSIPERPAARPARHGGDSKAAGTPAPTIVTTPSMTPGAGAAPHAQIRSVVAGSAGTVRTPGLLAGTPQAGLARSATFPPPRRLSVRWDGQLWLRLETLTPLDYRLPGTFGRSAGLGLPDRADLSLARTRVGAALRVARGVSGYASLQAARATGPEGSPLGTIANVALYRGWLDFDTLGVQGLGLRFGRQALSYGEGRVVGTSDWELASGAVDGARLRWTRGRAQADVFSACLDAGTRTGRVRVLSGFDARWRRSAGFELEAYQFRRAFAGAGWTSESGGSGSLHDATTGLRTRAVRGSFEFRLEDAVQRGSRAGDPVAASFRMGRVTADFGSEWKTRVYAEYARASGDRDPNDGTFQRFEPVHWDGHPFQGALDIAGESNMGDWCAGIAAEPSRGWSVESALHVLSLSSARDAWLTDAGGTMRFDASGASGTAVGHEWDATVGWAPRPGLSVLAGGSWFSSGAFVRSTGGGGAQGWGFLELNLGF